MARSSAIGALAVAFGLSLAQLSPVQPKPMSVHNRLLLNRLVVAGHRTLDVMLAVDVRRFEHVLALVDGLGGRTRKTEPSIGYARVTIPLESLLALVADPGVDAYQISSLSRGAWYRDGPPQANAEMFRGFEVGPVTSARPTESSDLPLLSLDAARQAGYTGDGESGVGEWLNAHPTFDGRGVTIAFLETGQPEFTHPALASARAIDGREIPKIAGILNTIDPNSPDETRVDLSTEVRAVSTWCRVGLRTYILPRPGTYRFGVFALPASDNLVQTFGVVRDRGTGEIRVDADGDGDFRDDAPMADVNDRLDVRWLRIKFPRQADVPFVVASGRTPTQVHIYLSRHGHQTMTISVAAGSRTDEGLAFGVAPAARVLLVRNHTVDSRLHDILEGYIEAIKRPDVDLLCDSAGILMAPDTEEDFVGLFFRRLIAAYRKPIVHGAGNSLLFLNNVSAFGDAMAVGGSIGAATFAAFYGGTRLDDTIVHPLSVGGPALDGALKPDVLAPMNRIAASLMTSGDAIPLPKNAPTSRLPSGYTISCCTSAASPYAAGVAALLLSGAKQRGLPYTVESLGRAMRVGARFLPRTPANQQGNGLLDVAGAWRELQRPVSTPRMRVRASSVHALTPYAAGSGEGPGLFEREGWKAGMRGRRVLQLTRESGSPLPLTYRLSWTGNDGTFDAARSVTLPLSGAVSLPVEIAAASPGVHSAVLNLHDAMDDAIVARAAVTIVAADSFDAFDHRVRLAGSVAPMQNEAHYFAVPNGVNALSFELDVLEGSVGAVVLPSHGLVREYYGHVFPQAGRSFGKGRYSLLLPHPAPGVWSLTITNDSVWREPNRALASTAAGRYAVEVRALTAALEARSLPDGGTRVTIVNRGAAIERPALDLSTGTLRSHRGRFARDGLPARFEIDVPADTETLMLVARSVEPATSLLELHAYDCSSGECFSYDFTVPARTEQTLVVRRPNRGRWIVAVNPAPSPAPAGGFVLDELLTRRGSRQPLVETNQAASSWTATIDSRGIGEPPAAVDATPVVLCELVDVEAERQALANPWENRNGLQNLAERTVGIGAVVVPVR